MKSALTSLAGCCRLAGASAQPRTQHAVNDLRFVTARIKWLINTFQTSYMLKKFQEIKVTNHKNKIKLYN